MLCYEDVFSVLFEDKMPAWTISLRSSKQTLGSFKEITAINKEPMNSMQRIELKATMMPASHDDGYSK